MTTIAYDGKTLAADSRCTGPSILQEPLYKIMGVGEFYIAGAGNLSAILRWADWFTGNNAEYPFHHSEDPMFEAIMVVHRETFMLDVYEYTSPLPVLSGVSTPYAIGSGGQYALGAMLAGKNAEQAVKIAAKLDPLTDDNVIVYKKETKRRSRR